MKTMIAALLAAAFAAPATLAYAQGTTAATISQEEAIEIASKKGMATVQEIELDGREWEIEGCSADGRELEIDIHSQTGDILKYDLDRDKDDDCAPVTQAP